MDIETETFQSQLPAGIVEFAYRKFNTELDGLYYPDLYVLPLTPEGETERERLYSYQHDDKGNLIHQSIARYGAYQYNFTFENELYLAILVNND